MIDSVFGLHKSLFGFDEKDDGSKMDVDSTPHASPDNGEADQAGSFLFKQLPAALTYDQLVDKLIEKGLVIDEEERPHVINVLSYIGYYRLRGYWITLEKDKRFYAGVIFSDIEGNYALDSALRHWLLGAIEPIEVKLRSQLAHHLALAYGPDAFYSPEPLLSTAQWEGSMRAVRREIERAKREGKPSICHNLEVYWSTEWGNRYADLERIIAAHPTVDLKPMGFPENWADILDTHPIVG